jgi:hypothetical protein
MRMRSLYQRLRIEFNTEHIGYLGKCQNLHSRIIDLLEFFFREMAGFLVNVDIVKDSACLLGSSLPGDEVGMMFRNRDEDMVALLQVCLAIGAGYEIQGFCRVSGINDFFFASCMDEVTDDLFGSVVSF